MADQETVVYDYSTASWIKIATLVSWIAFVIFAILGVASFSKAIGFGFLSLLISMIGLFLGIFFLQCFCSLTITNKRVTGKVPIGKRIDLPIQHVTAVASAIGAIKITTPTGVITFWLIDNKDKAYSELNRLIMEALERK